jgi:hypothetical protein
LSNSSKCNFICETKTKTPISGRLPRETAGTLALSTPKLHPIQCYLAPNLASGAPTAGVALTVSRSTTACHYWRKGLSIFSLLLLGLLIAFSFHFFCRKREQEHTLLVSFLYQHTSGCYLGRSHMIATSPWRAAVALSAHLQEEKWLVIVVPWLLVDRNGL